MSGPLDISIVIPVYREAAHLAATLSVIRAEAAKAEASFEIVLVDDGSEDQTWQVICGEIQRTDGIRAVRLSRNFGKEAALCAGVEAARGRAVIIMDGDLQHPPAMIPEMVRLWRSSGANIVEAVKVRHDTRSLKGRLAGWLFYAMMSKLSGFDLHGASDFKLIDAQVRQAWLKLGERNLFFRGMIAWLGFKRAQVSVTVPDRADGGKSRWSFWALMKLAATALMAFSSLPLRVPTIFGAAFLTLSAGLGSYALVLWFLGKAVTGFTTVILLLLILGSLILLSLGIIAEYLGRVYDEVKARPRYIIAEVLDERTPAPDAPACAAASNGLPGAET